MALRQGQRKVRVSKGFMADYLYDHNKIVLKEKVVGASDEDEDIVFLVEKVDDQED